jgi:hypothetical protein
MGEVHRGRDTRLNRTVAIKVLPDDLAGDSERLARFDREAQTLAQLNHPNIAQIYGVEEFSTGPMRMHALAMEFVDGEDLADRIRRGPIPVGERFDVDRLALAGEPEPIAEQVGSQGALGLFAVSPQVLAYRNGRSVTGGINNQLTWLDRAGQPAGRLGDPGPYESAFISPDFTHVATTFMAIENRDVVTFDIERGLPVRFTSGPEIESNPVWSPDGQQVVFRSGSGGQIGFRRRRSDGSERDEELLVSPEQKFATAWHGDFLLYQVTDSNTKDDIWLLPLTGDRNPVEVLRTPFNEANASIAPDGRWIAYSSDETGRLEVYARAFERTSSGEVRLAGKIPVSKDGGTAPRWRRDGKELLFTAEGQAVMSVDVTTSPALRLSLAKQLFALPPGAFRVSVGPVRRRHAIPRRRAGTDGHGRLVADHGGDQLGCGVARIASAGQRIAGEGR